MDKITIDGVDYKLSSLDKSTLDQVLNLQKVDAEIRNQQFLLAVAHKARSAYAAALNAALPKTHQ